MSLKINHPLLNGLYKIADGAAALSGNPTLQAEVKKAEAKIDRQVDTFEARLPEPAQRALYLFGELGRKVGL